MKTTLGKIPAGADFKIWERTFTVLKSDKNSVLVLDSDVVFHGVPFMDLGEKSPLEPNNFRDSTLKKWLNTKYLDLLIKRGAVVGTDILSQTINLETPDGRESYGTDTVMVGGLTTEQFKEHRDIIPKSAFGWWLVTPSRITNSSSEFSSTFVNESHLIQTGMPIYRNTARAALNLSPNLEVEYDSDENNNWSSYVEYLLDWADSHADRSFTGCSPASYEEWLTGKI